MDKEIAELLEGSKRITVLTGAGVSTDSGIPDFKFMDQSWDFEEPREAMLSAPFWRRHPQRFWEVYRSTLRSTEDTSALIPSSFHRWLVDLEQSPTVQAVDILTQNVDGLHSKAGSTRVIEAHGNSSRAICIECKHTVPMVSIADDPLPMCMEPECDMFPVLKPDISLFFEGVNGLGDFRRAIDRSDLLIVAGTSLNVGPVNELPYYAQTILRPTLWISDEEPPDPDFYHFSHRWIGKLSDFVKSFSL